MSRVYKRLTPTGKVRWWVCVTYRGQRHREVAGDSKKAALKRLGELEARLDRGTDVTPKKVPLDFLCDEYLRWAEVNLAPRTRKERMFAINAHLKPFFRGLVTDINVQRIEAYKSMRMATGIASWTMNNELKVVSCIFRFAIENNYVEEIPKIRRVKVVKKPTASCPRKNSLRSSRPPVRMFVRCCS